MNVQDVIERLRAVERGLPEKDGVRWFNELYLRVTERVHRQLGAGGFEDPVFMRRLDERFADLYLEAIDGGSSAAWLPLIQARADRSIAPERFMLAGINAHINYDLPVALADTCFDLGGTLTGDTPRHRDFERIDEILADVEREIHRRLHTARLKEVIALWEVIRARDHAWEAALKLVAAGPGTTRPEVRAGLDQRVADWSELLLHLPQ